MRKLILTIIAFFCLTGVVYTQNLQHHTDKISNLGGHGWVVDCSKPYSPVSLNVYFNDKYAETISAGQPRLDLIGQTCTTNEFHGFSFAVPVATRAFGGVIQIKAITQSGKEVVVYSGTIPPDPKLECITNGILTACMNRDEGIITTLRSTEFPQVDNFFDQSALFGRGFQADINTCWDGSGFNPTEGGSDFGGYPVHIGNSPIINQEARNISTRMKTRNWCTGQVMEIYISRLTRLSGNILDSVLTIENYTETPITHAITNAVNVNSRYLNHVYNSTGDIFTENAAIPDQYLVDSPSSILTLFNSLEGISSYTMSIGSRVVDLSSPGPIKYTDKSSVLVTWYRSIAEGFPRCFFGGTRYNDITILPNQSLTIRVMVTITKGVDASRKIIFDNLISK